MDIVGQLGGLFAQALPVVILILLFYFFLKANFFGPLERVMAERDARTAGARKAADEAQAAAQEKVKAYQEALKKARAEVYAEQDVARKGVLEERATLVKDARARANAQVAVAKQQMAAELAAARVQLGIATESLGDAIAESILKGAR
jgi:F-type H+-transporting ATPase subunit b